MDPCGTPHTISFRSELHELYEIKTVRNFEPLKTLKILSLFYSHFDITLNHCDNTFT